MDPCDVAPRALLCQVLLEALNRRGMDPDRRPMPLRSADEYKTTILTLLEQVQPGVRVDEALDRAIDGTDRPSWFASVNELAELAHARETGALTIH